MAIDADPVIGHWYQHLENGQKFEVVDIDEDRGVVGVRYADGDEDEVDMDEWYELELESAAEPDEEWSDEIDDLSYVGGSDADTWSRPKRGGGAKRQADDFEEDDDAVDWDDDDGEDAWEEE